jgi:arabinofuranosyltransferase
MGRPHADNLRSATTATARRLVVAPVQLLALALILGALAGSMVAGQLQAPSFRPVAAGRLDPGPVFVDGLYGPEVAADGSTYRWTSGAALLQLRGAFSAAPAYRAELRLRAENPAGPQPLTIVVGGSPVATVTPDTRFRTYRLLLGPAPDSGAELWLALNTPTFEAPVNPRPLGVTLTDVALRPVARADLASAAWAPLGVLALFVAMRLAGLPWREALALSALAALGLGAAALLHRPSAVPPLLRGALILGGVGGAALVARQQASRLGLAALTTLASLSGQIWPSWLSDDAFISFRYAQNLAQGHGLVYNLGERVEGYTNFLWTVLAAGVIALGGDVAVWSHLSGIGLAIAVLMLTYRIGARLLAPGWGLVAALIAGTSQSLLLYTARGSGLETGLFTLLVLAASERYLASWWRERATGDGGQGATAAAGLLLGLAALTRPEGVMVFALTVAHCALRLWVAGPQGSATSGDWLRRSVGSPSSAVAVLRSLLAPRSPLWPLCGAFLIIYIPYFLWRLGYYGDVLPNTFYAKTGGGASQVLRGLNYAAGFALTLGGPLLLVIALPWWRSWRVALASWRGYLLPLALVYTAYIVAVGGDHFRGERFFVPIIPWLAILLADGIALVAGPVAQGPSRIRGRLVALACLGLALAALLRTAPDDVTMQGLDESVWIWREIGWWMADHASPEASVAAAGAGAPAFYGERTTIDLYGLTDKHIGRLEVADMGQGVAGHEKRDPAYVLNERMVTYIPRIWDAYFGGAEGLRDSYRLISVTTRTGRSLQLWERIANP